jgi:hypothetical protein
VGTLFLGASRDNVELILQCELVRRVWFLNPLKPEREKRREEKRREEKRGEERRGEERRGEERRGEERRNFWLVRNITFSRGKNN